MAGAKGLVEVCVCVCGRVWCVHGQSRSWPPNPSPSTATVLQVNCFASRGPPVMRLQVYTQVRETVPVGAVVAVLVALVGRVGCVVVQAHPGRSARGCRSGVQPTADISESLPCFAAQGAKVQISCGFVARALFDAEMQPATPGGAGAQAAKQASPQTQACEEKKRGRAAGGGFATRASKQTRAKGARSHEREWFSLRHPRSGPCVASDAPAAPCWQHCGAGQGMQVASWAWV